MKNFILMVGGLIFTTLSVAAPFNVLPRANIGVPIGTMVYISPTNQPLYYHWVLFEESFSKNKQAPCMGLSGTPLEVVHDNYVEPGFETVWSDEFLKGATCFRITYTTQQGARYSTGKIALRYNVDGRQIVGMNPETVRVDLP